MCRHPVCLCKEHAKSPLSCRQAVTAAHGGAPPRCLWLILISCFHPMSLRLWRSARLLRFCTYFQPRNLACTDFRTRHVFSSFQDSLIAHSYPIHPLLLPACPHRKRSDTNAGARRPSHGQTHLIKTLIGLSARGNVDTLPGNGGTPSRPAPHTQLSVVRHGCPAACHCCLAALQARRQVAAPERVVPALPPLQLQLLAAPHTRGQTA